MSRCLATAPRRSLFLAFALVVTLPVSRGNAQSLDGVAPLRNSISVLGGAFTYDHNNNPAHHHPYVTLRLGHDFSRYFAGELGFGYADVKTTQYRLAPTIEEFSFRTPVATSDLAFHLMLPIRAFVPYVGASAGLFHRFDSRNGMTPGEDTQGTSVGVLAGSKLHFGDLFGLRAELRLRADRHPDRQFRFNDAEYSLGMIFRF